MSSQPITAMTAVPALVQAAVVTDSPTTTAPPEQTSSTEPPAPSSTQSAAPTSTAPPTTQPPTTTTTEPPPPTTQRSSNVEVGDASWYDYHPGSCAHPWLPFGTVVTVTSLASGASTTCTVGDRGPTVPGRVIDLEREVFAQLASPSLGVISVRITW